MMGTKIHKRDRVDGDVDEGKDNNKLWWEMDKSMYPPTRQLLLDPDDVKVTQISGRRIFS